jgi:tetratricopeptide (TPR) repeat protein
VLAAGVVVVPLAAVRAVAQPAALAPPLAEVQEMDRQEKPVASGEPAKGITPERADDWAQLGKSYLRQRRYPEAIEALSNAIRAEPFYASARYNLACAYALSGDRAAALAALREAVRAGYSGGGHMRKDEDLVSIRGSELDALADLADQLSLGAKGDNWSSVIPHYERVAREHSDIPQAWFNLGFALISSNQERRGIEAFTRALQMGYRPGTTMYNLGCAYAHLGERETAIEWLHRSAAAGFDVGNQARSDRDLDSVRSDPWLASMVAATVEKKKGKDKNKD